MSLCVVCGGEMCGIGGEVTSSEKGDLGEAGAVKACLPATGRLGQLEWSERVWQVGWREAGQPICTPVLRPCLPGWGSVGLSPIRLSVCLSVWCTGLETSRQCCVAEAITLPGWVLSAQPSFDDALSTGTGWARARLRKAVLTPAGQKGVLPAEGLLARPLHHPHPIRLAAQAGQIIFAPSDSASAFAPLPGVTQLPVSVFYFQSKAGPPSLASSTTSLRSPFPSILPWTGWVPRARSKGRVALVESEGGLTPLSSTSSFSCFLPTVPIRTGTCSNTHR